MKKFLLITTLILTTSYIVPSAGNDKSLSTEVRTGGKDHADVLEGWDLGDDSDSETAEVLNRMSGTFRAADASAARANDKKSELDSEIVPMIAVNGAVLASSSTHENPETKHNYFVARRVPANEAQRDEDKGNQGCLAIFQGLGSTLTVIPTAVLTSLLSVFSDLKEKIS